MQTKQKIYICRHGETEWSASGQHTGLTDIPLTKNGIHQANCLANRLAKLSFDQVFCSPLIRAKKTAEACGLLKSSIIHKGLLEWDYGDYEGLKTEQIRKEKVDWDIFKHGPKNGESLKAIIKRADNLIKDIETTNSKNIALFTSGHISRVLIARWLGLPVEYGRCFILSTASLSILGYDKETRAIQLLNDVSHYA